MPDTLKTSDFYYDLPEELIAQTPAEPRDSSRLLVYHREKKSIEHRIFRDITDYLKAGDVLVLNRTRVLPARLYARTEHGGAAEVLLLKRLDLREWEVLVRPGRKCRPGAKLFVNDELSLEVLSVTETGERIVRFSYEGTFEDVLSRAGTMPLPPYIHEKLKDPDQQRDGLGGGAHGGAALHARTFGAHPRDGRGDRRGAAPCGLRHLPPRQRGERARSQDALRALRSERGGGGKDQFRQARRAPPSAKGGASSPWARLPCARWRRSRTRRGCCTPARAIRASFCTRPIR